MRQIPVLIAALALVTAAGAAQSLPDVAVTPDHPLHDVKTSVEDAVERTAPNASEKAKTKVAQAERRLAEAERMADKNRSDLAEKAAGNYSEEMEGVQGIGAEVSDLAEQGKIDELVATATSFHASVLSRVYEKVPEQAKAGIGRALNTSVQGHNRAVAAMERRGQDTSGAGNITAAIPADVRQATGVNPRGPPTSRPQQDGSSGDQAGGPPTQPGTGY